MNWTIPPNLTAPLFWLRLSNLFGSASGGGGASSTTLSVFPDGLAEGVYQVLVPVSAPGAVNDPQIVTVTLHVAPPSAPASPELSPSGILFVAEVGSGDPAPSSLRVENLGGGSATFQVQTSTESGGNWLSASPTSGSVAAQAGSIFVRASLASLTPGTYRGRITVTFTPGGARVVDVVLVYADPSVPPPEPYSYNDYQLLRGEPRAALCGGGTMQMVVQSLGTGSVVPVSFPRPLTVSVVDSCGDGIDATVAAFVEGRTIALTPLGDGIYHGTWVPDRATESITISFAAVHVVYPRVDQTITVSTAAAAGGVSLPVLFSDGVVEGAAFTSRRPLAPGGIISLFGSGFAAAEVPATQLPLERALGGVSVRIGGEDAPLYFAAPGQVNAQVPYSVQPGSDVPVVVRVNGRLTAPQTYLVAPVQPGVFFAGDGGAILDDQSRLVNADNPGRRGTVLQIFATGLGQTNPPGQTGQGAPSSSQVLLPVTVTVGGVDAPVQYQGLAPGYVGLYQVNVVLPTTVTPGENVEVVLKQNGVPSNPDRAATIPVR